MSSIVHIYRRKPTIYEALAAKLNREPSNTELKADVQRILTDGLVEMAMQGKLTHQKKGYFYGKSVI